MSDIEPVKILVIDDDEMALLIMRKLLEAENCVVEALTSPREALAKLPENRYDAILCDMWMAGMSGKEFYEQLKEEFPEYQRRVIFVTGDLASEATWDFIDDRHLPYVLKPFNRPELRRKLRQVIGERPVVAQPKMPVQAVEPGVERRSHRRITMNANVRVRRKKWAVGAPDIKAVVNASKEGIFFLTDEKYRVGTEVLVAFPYVGYGDIEQEGYVVRVEEQPEGQRGVGIALGEAAEAARANFAGSEEDARRHHILNMADLSAQVLPTVTLTEETAAGKTADEREEARRFAEELVELKSTHDRVVNQRDRLVAEEAKLSQQLREMAAAKAAITQVVDDLNVQMGVLQKDVAKTEEYRFQATHDALTGLWNRGAILDTLKRELVRSQREGTSVGVILADLDHFKNINDSYGHLAGDAVLCESAKKMSAAVRAYDAVGRYGGEEFLIVLSASNEVTVKQAERIRVLVSAEPVSTAEGVIAVTLSLGVAAGSEAKEMESLLRAADAALYRAKSGGRNRVEAATAADAAPNEAPAARTAAE